MRGRTERSEAGEGQHNAPANRPHAVFTAPPHTPSPQFLPLLLISLFLALTLTACSNSNQLVDDGYEVMTPFPPRETVSPAETIDELLGFASVVVVGTLGEPESVGLLYPADTLEPGWALTQLERFAASPDVDAEFEIEAFLEGLSEDPNVVDPPSNQAIVDAIAARVAETASEADDAAALDLFDFEFALDRDMVDPVTDYPLSMEQVLYDGTELNIEAGSALPLRIYGHDPAADASAFEGLEYLRFETNLEPGQRYLILLDTFEFETDIFTEVPYAEGAYLLAEDGVTLADGSDVPYAQGISTEAFIRMVSVAVGKRE